MMIPPLEYCIAMVFENHAQKLGMTCTRALLLNYFIMIQDVIIESST